MPSPFPGQLSQDFLVAPGISKVSNKVNALQVMPDEGESLGHHSDQTETTASTAKTPNNGLEHFDI